MAVGVLEKGVVSVGECGQRVLVWGVVVILDLVQNLFLERGMR